MIFGIIEKCIVGYMMLFRDTIYNIIIYKKMRFELVLT